MEEEAREYPKVQRILKKYSNIPQITCHHYGEIFNIKNQNFRTQKQFPALIIAIKKGKKVIEAPEGFGIGGSKNYYFSHMQNCLYDCRYCFLQGMYNSANYLWFVNYEGFISEIRDIALTSNQTSYFFSGYDCDSLVFESLTGFAQEFITFFKNHKNAILELRTKSVNIKALENTEVVKNVITAFSFTTEETSKMIEHKVPPVRSRIKAIQKLSNLGWQVGLRFDPMIYTKDYQASYSKLINDIFNGLNTDNLHSISIGPLRFPKKMHEKITKLYPSENLLTENLIQTGNIISYKKETEAELKTFITDELSIHAEKTKIFSCTPA